MFTVGLDEMNSLILYSQLVILDEVKDSKNLEMEIILGSMLGDGKLEMSPRSLNARFGLIQSEGKRDYI